MRIDNARTVQTMPIWYSKIYKQATKKAEVLDF